MDTEMRNIFNLYAMVLILAFASSCKKDRHTADLEVTVAHHKETDSAFLILDMSFEADPSGITHLIYKDKAWGQDSLFNALKEVYVLGEGTVKMERDSNRITIEHDPDLKRLDVRYRLEQDYQGPTTSRKVYRPIIQPEFFQVFGQNLFVLPERIAEKETFDVLLHWNVPGPEFKLQNSFANHKREQRIEHITRDELDSSVFTGGDFRIYDIDLQGNQVAFAIRDTWEAFDDSTMVDLLEATISAQREFWNDHSQPYFSVTMIPIYEPSGSSWQGTGLTNSFALAASNNDYLEVQGLAYLLNHELQHNWIGLKIKNDNEEEQYWFSEGFTDYYTLKNIAIHRIYDLDENYFVQEFNSKLKNLYNSPVVAAPNSEINYENFWKDRHYSDLPYLRGAVFAFILDQRIRRDSDGKQSLDNVMKKLHENSDTKLSHSYFLETIHPYLKAPVDPFFERHMIQGVPFEMATIFKELGLEYDLSNVKVFELGVKKDDDDARHIAEVTPGSNAYKAGLRAGDRIVSHSFVYEQPDVEATFVVKRGDQELDIKFFPARQMEIPQLTDSEHNLSLLGFDSDSP